MNKLPVLISIPHGGRRIPAELASRLLLEEADIFEDIDPFTREIYNIGTKASHVISSPIARTAVDVNRAPDDLPPVNPDGVIKSKTCFGKVVYKPGFLPNETLISALLSRYYHPYHNQIRETLEKETTSIELSLDCHSMAATGPDIAPDTGEKRPLFCLSNRFGDSCPNKQIDKLAECFGKAFNLPDNEISLNKPFSGGFITRHYGSAANPWIQVELNRSLYLRQPYFDTSTLSISTERLQELKDSFKAALVLFFSP